MASQEATKPSSQREGLMEESEHSQEGSIRAFSSVDNERTMKREHIRETYATGSIFRLVFRGREGMPDASFSSSVRTSIKV